MEYAKKRLLLILNPVAGKQKSEKELNAIVQAFSTEKYDVTAFFTQKQGDATQYVIKYAPDHDYVVCGGGDGTLSEAVAGVVQSGCDLPVGYLPMGTTNDVARTLGLPLTIPEAIAAAQRGAPVAQDVALFNGEKYFSYVASFGAFTEASYNTPQWLKNKLGYHAYILTGLFDLGRHSPLQAQVEMGGYSLEGAYMFGSVTNSTSVAKIIKLDNQIVRLDDGKFEVLLVRHPQNPLDMERILNCISHQDYSTEHVVLFQTDAIKFEFANEIAWTLDGEYAGTARSAQIRVLHNAVRIVRPV